MKKYLALAVLFLCACAAAPVQEVSSNEIEASKGFTFEIALDANPTTGYSWFIKNESALKTVSLKTQRFNAAAEKGVVGAPSKQVFTFTAVNGGSENIILEYKRPWEKGVAPIDVKTYKVTVK